MSITNYDGLLEAMVENSKDLYINLAKINEAYDDTPADVYAGTLPGKYADVLSIKKIGGKTIVFNQLVDEGTVSVPTISGHKYYTLINGTASIVTSDGTAISVVDDTADMVFDLTLMFGVTNEPATTNAFMDIFPAAHYDYDAGTLLSVGVDSVVSKDSNNAVLGSFPIPAEIQALEGYGRGIFHYRADTPYYAYNYIDFERKKFVKHVASVRVTSADVPAADSGYIGTATLVGDWGVYTGTTVVWIRNFKTIYQSIVTGGYAGLTEKFTMTINNKGISSSQYRTVFFGVPDRDTLISLIGDGLDLYYELETPVETDISEYLKDDVVKLDVEAGGTLTFENTLGDDYRIPVPVQVEMIGVS